MILLLTLLGCQQPFGSDRHTLEDFRIAGMGLVLPDDDTLRAHALVVDGGRLWADTRTELAWAWLDADQDPDSWTGLADHLGPWPLLDVPDGGGTLLLVAIAPDGTERRAVLELDDVPGTAPAVAPLAPALLPWTLGRLQDEDLTIEVRSKATGEPSWQVAPDGFLRLAETGDDARPLRWMGTGGTWLELDSQSADWTPGSLLLDGGEIEQTKDGSPGIHTLVALRPTTEGGAWRVHDVFVGEPPDEPGAWVNGRWLAGAIEGWQTATLVADDAAAVGLRAEGATAVSPAALPVGTAPVDRCVDFPLFDPDWLADQRCLRGELTGRPIAFEGVSTGDEANPQ